MLRRPRSVRRFGSTCSAGRNIIPSLPRNRQVRHDSALRNRALGVLARHPARSRSGRDARVARGVRRARRGGGSRPRDVPPQAAARPGAREARQAAAGLQHRVQEHDRARGPAAVSGQPRSRAAPGVDHPLERARDGRAREPRARGARRPHRELRLGRGSLRGRLQPFLPRRRHGKGGSPDRRRPRVLPAALGAGRVRARVPRRPVERGTARALSPRSRGRAACRRTATRG